MEKKLDKIDIANLALSHIGVASIERMDQPTEAARAVEQFYDHVRRTLLRSFYWTFAVRRTELALVESDLKDYRYAYRYPSDALRIRRVYCKGNRMPWRKERYEIVSEGTGGVIYTNVQYACMEYVANITDTSLFDDLFVDAFSWKLAAEVAMRLTGKIELANNAIQAYNAYIAEAQGINANENREPEPYVNRLAAARLGCDLYDKL